MPATTDEGAAEAAGPAVAAGPAPAPRPSGTALLRGAGDLLRACHPVPAAGVTLLAALLAAAFGLTLRTGAGAVAAVAAGQLSVGWSNDRLDLGRDRAARRRDKPLAAGTVRPAVVTAAASAALFACVPLSLACGTRAGLVHLGCVAAAWAYNLWLKHTAASWLPYALAFGLLPAFLSLACAPGRWPPPWLTAAAALLGTAAHFANTLPDIDADRAAGVRGLPQRLGRRGSLAAAAGLAFASGAALALGPPGPVSPAGRLLLLLTAALSLGAAAAPPALARSRLPFLAVLALAGADAVLLVLASRDLAAP